MGGIGANLIAMFGDLIVNESRCYVLFSQEKVDWVDGSTALSEQTYGTGFEGSGRMRTT